MLTPYERYLVMDHMHYKQKQKKKEIEKLSTVAESSALRHLLAQGYDEETARHALARMKGKTNDSAHLFGRRPLS